MNIFATSPSPEESAVVLDDKRLNKMILESAQLMCTTLNLLGIKTPYRSTHANHPVRLWVGETSANYYWLLQHFICLNTEFLRRNSKIHKCNLMLEIFLDGANHINLGLLTPHPNCTPFKEELDTHQAYKMTLCKKWKEDKRKPTWKNSNPPDWYPCRDSNSVLVLERH